VCATVDEPEAPTTNAKDNKDKLTQVLHTIKEWKAIVARSVVVSDAIVSNTGVNTYLVVRDRNF